MANDLKQRDEHELARELEKSIRAFLALPNPAVYSPELSVIQLQLEFTLFCMRRFTVH
jgi:hypothetical protein